MHGEMVPRLGVEPTTPDYKSGALLSSEQWEFLPHVAGVAGQPPEPRAFCAQYQGDPAGRRCALQVCLQFALALTMCRLRRGFKP